MHLLFDLDGTLTNPFLGITRCIQHALRSMDREVPDAEELRWCIGPPLHASFLALLETSDAGLGDRALELYRERFATVGLFENEVYPGIESCLQDLTTAGYRLWVATSKPGVYAERIVEHFGLSDYFSAVHGSELDGTRTDKTELIAHLLQSRKINPKDAVMIGDRRHDIIGAANNGVVPVGVGWGFGGADELAEAGARCIVSAPHKLAQSIVGIGLGDDADDEFCSANPNN